MKTKKSKVQIIKEALQAGRKLTALDAWKLCRSLCLRRNRPALEEIPQHENQRRICDRERVPFRRVFACEIQEGGK